MAKRKITEFFKSKRNCPVVDIDQPITEPDASSPISNKESGTNDTLPTPSSSSQYRPVFDALFPDAPEKPDSTYIFPSREYGQGNNKHTKRCSHAILMKFPWAHYNRTRDVVFCHVCVSALRKKLVCNPSQEVFVETGFHNWNDIGRCFKKHQNSELHIDSLAKLAVPKEYEKTLEDFNESCASNKQFANEMLVHIVEALKYLARQNIAIRGGNFSELLQLISTFDPKLAAWMKRKHSYVSADNQNEILKIMASDVTRQIVANIVNSGSYCLMIDESTDKSNKEQVVFCMRWVDTNLEAHEEFLGLYQVSSTSADSLVKTIKDVLLQLSIPLAQCRGQCYDGASVMAGLKGGVATKIQQENPRAVYIHCFAHSLNLSVQDTVKRSALIRQTLDLSLECTKLVKASPKRQSWLELIKDRDRYSDEDFISKSGIKLFCRTRWTVKAETLQAIVNNYRSILTLWDEILEGDIDSETRAKVLGVKSQMEKFNFLFGLMLSLTVFRLTDNLSRSLQSSSRTALSGSKLATDVVKVLSGMRSESNFDQFWERVDILRAQLGIAEAVAPRPARPPSRFYSSSEPHHHTSAKDKARQNYYEVLDLTISGINSRFHQKGMQVMTNIEQLILNAISGNNFSSQLDFIEAHCGDNIIISTLQDELRAIACINLEDICDVGEFTSWLKQNDRRLLYPELTKVVRLVVVLPATNASSERSFSAMRRLKTFLRTSMTQQRLNNLMMLHIHRDLASQLDPQSIIKQFVSGHHDRSLRIAVKQ